MNPIKAELHHWWSHTGRENFIKGISVESPHWDAAAAKLTTLIIQTYWRLYPEELDRALATAAQEVSAKYLYDVIHSTGWTHGDWK